MGFENSVSGNGSMLLGKELASDNHWGRIEVISSVPEGPSPIRSRSKAMAKQILKVVNGRPLITPIRAGRRLSDIGSVGDEAVIRVVRDKRSQPGSTEMDHIGNWLLDDPTEFDRLAREMGQNPNYQGNPVLLKADPDTGLVVGRGVMYVAVYRPGEAWSLGLTSERIAANPGYCNDQLSMDQVVGQSYRAEVSGSPVLFQIARADILTLPASN